MIYRIPVETLALAISWARRRDLLALRCAFSGGRDVVRRGVRSCPDCREVSLTSRSNSVPRLPAHAIEAIGRVLGPGCRRLEVYLNTTSELVAVLRFVVDCTNRSLEELVLAGSNVGLDLLLELCRACPLLTSLRVWRSPLLEAAGIVEIATKVGPICPMLERVTLPGDVGPMSEAECWAMHFPRLKELDFKSRSTSYSNTYWPRHFDKIDQIVANCTHLSKVDLEYCGLELALVERLVQSSLGTRLTSLDLTFTVISEGDAILKAAQGFSALRELFIPSEFEGDAKFFSNLCRARPELTALEFGGFEVTDACVKIACNNLRLRYLDIQSSSLTRALVDIILTSPSSETLEEVLFHNVPYGALDAAGLARLVAGCPVLSSVHYQEPCGHYPETYDATPDLAGVFDAIARRLESRGGALDLNAFS